MDIGYKAEGTISRNEFLNEEGELAIEVGSNVDVYLDSMSEADGTLKLSKRRADQMKAWEDIAKAHDAGETVKGTITSRVKGGLSVDIGVKAFLPGSQVDLRPVKNLEKMLGLTLEFKIIKFNKRRGNIVLSRRVLLEEDRKVKRLRREEPRSWRHHDRRGQEHHRLRCIHRPRRNRRTPSHHRHDLWPNHTPIRDG